MVRTQNFLSPAARVSGTNAKYSKSKPRVIVLRTQNILSSAVRGSGTHGSVARVSVTNAKFSKSSRAW